MLLQFFALGVMRSWEEAHPGARASRPHQAWHSLGHLLHLNRPAAAPWLSFGLAHAVPAGRAVGCDIAGKLSGNRRDSMRAGRPRSRVGRPDGEVGGIRRATSLKAGLSPLGNSRLPASRAPVPRDGADHSRKNSRSLMKTNHEWTRMDTNTNGLPSTTCGTKVLPQFCALGVMRSWDEAHLGARASRPHKSSRSFTHLLHRNQPAAAPCLCFGRAPAVPAGRAAGCNIAGKLSGNPRDSMRAGRPRSRVGRPDGEVGGIRRATSLKAGLSPLGNSRLPASRAPAWCADPARTNG